MVLAVSCDVDIFKLTASVGDLLLICDLLFDCCYLLNVSHLFCCVITDNFTI